MLGELFTSCIFVFQNKLLLFLSMTMLPYFGKGLIIHGYFVKKTLGLSSGKLRSVPTQELRTNIVLLGGASLI